METGNPKIVAWSALVESALEKLCNPDTPTRRLQPRDTPFREYHNQKERRLDQVDPKLLEVFQNLAHGKGKWPLFLHGPVGTGKTCSALALSDIVRTDWFGTVEDAIDVVMGKERRIWIDGRKNVWGESEVHSPRTALVVLDEIGARQRVTDLEYTTVKGFTDARELDYGGVAIYISNLEPQEISKVYDDRLASRLLCGTWFKLDGKDRRMEG